MVEILVMPTTMAIFVMVINIALVAMLLAMLLITAIAASSDIQRVYVLLDAVLAGMIAFTLYLLSGTTYDAVVTLSAVI